MTKNKDREVTNIGNKVLLIAASHVGNNIFCTPTIRFLKKHYPETSFDVVALNKHSAEVFHGNPDIDNIHVAHKKRTLNKISKEYSTVICMNDQSKDILSEIKTNLISAPPVTEESHHSEQLLQFVAGFTGCEITDTDRAYVIGSGIESHSSILDKVETGRDDILICMHLGCGRVATHGWKFFYKHRGTHKKLWPIDEYIKLGNRLISAHPKIRLVITGTKHESFLGKKFERNVPGTINLIGKTSVPELFRLMSDVHLFIAQDCGALHFAAASTVPLVGLFGPTNPTVTGPYPLKTNHTIIKKDSMAEIGTSEVVTAALNLLQNFPRTRVRIPVVLTTHAGDR